MPADGERVAIAGAPAPGPPEYNQVWVRKYGPRAARHVLVLVPLATLDLPLFVFETSLSRGGVLPAARRLIAESSIQRAVLESDEAMRHLDPLEDFPGRNRFVATVVPFLRTIVRTP